MFKKYVDFIKQAFNAIVSGGEVSLTDYLRAVGYGLGLMLVILFSGLLLFGSVLVPIKIYQKFISRDIDKLTSADMALNSSLLKKITRKKTLFFVGTIFVYIPVMVPTLLFVFELVTRIF